MPKLKGSWEFCRATLKTYPLYFVSVVILPALLSILLSNVHQQREVNHLIQVTKLHRMQTEAVGLSLENVADIIFQLAINRDDILKIMAFAHKSSEVSERDELRALLLERLSLVYDDLKDKGLRQLHFHLPGGVSFLRFHKPEAYGDSLQGPRPSIGQVNKTKEPAHGFETGRYFPALRNVYPLFHGHEFVGSVELSYAFLAERELAYQLFPAIYTLILDEKRLVKALEPGLEKDYMLTRVSSSHVRANRMAPYVKQELVELDLLSFADFKKLTSMLHDVVEERLRKNQAFSVAQQLSDVNKVIVASFLPINDVKGEPLAYYVIYHEDLSIKGFNRQFAVMQRVVRVLALFLLAGGFVYARQVLGKEKYKALAINDTLTGLANRHHFNLILEENLRQTRRSERPLSFVMLDIDNFKQVNDTYGHDVGDQVLIALAAKLQRLTREQDFIARWGGEEFVLLLPDTASEQACHAVEKFRTGVAEMVIPAGINQIGVTASFGVAEYVKGMKRDELFKLADEALYRAKAGGKNCVVQA